MSYIENDPVWFLAPRFLLAACVLLFGCDGPSYLTGSRAADPIEAPRYREVAEQQYRALDFLDRYVEDRVEAGGKRPGRERLAHLIVEAHENWLRREGVPEDEILAFHEQFVPHLRGGLSADRQERLAPALAHRGFSPDQQRFIRRLLERSKTAPTFDSLREELRATAADARAGLPGKEAHPVVYAAARMEGIGRFLWERQPLAFGFARLQGGPGRGAKGSGNRQCARGPEPETYFHRPWKYLKDAATGFGLGCGVGSAMFSWTAVGSTVACSIGGSWGTGLGIYWQYKRAEERYLTNLRAWCDECVYNDESPASGVGTCRVKFPADYPRR